MGRSRPKQYLSFGGAPLIVHTLRALARAVQGIVVAAPAAYVEATRQLLLRHRVPRVLAVVAGGAERQDSVWLALSALPQDARWVIVHDAVRPFITPALIERVLAAARTHGAATCGLAVRETVKRVQDTLVQSTLDREGLWLTQTPQAFRRELLWEAHDKARREGFLGTDDAMLVERLGADVAMVPGHRRNLKITTPEDLDTARQWLVRPAGRGSA